MLKEKLKKSLVENKALWIFIWILGILDIFSIICITIAYSNMLLIAAIIIMLIGVLALRRIYLEFSQEKALSAELAVKISDLMKTIKPQCDNIFENSLDRITQPLLSSVEHDFTTSLVWIRENNEDYLAKLQEGIAEIRSIIRIDNTVERNKIKIIRKLQEKLEQLIEILSDLKSDKEGDQEEIRNYLNNKVLELKQNMEKEKEIFYDYIEKLLIQQNLGTKGIALAEYLNFDRLSEQLSMVIEKSIQLRLTFFKDNITQDLEFLLADLVGKMQKGATQLKNIFSDVEELTELLKAGYRDDNVVTIRKLQESCRKIADMKEQANDFLVTLAWQDILIEKRWQDIQTRLFILRDQILEKVNDDVVQYIIGILNKMVPGYTTLSNRAETAVVYKACMDAEIIYQLLGSDRIKGIINDDVYSLLQFARPIELMVQGSLRFSETAISERRLIKDKLKEPEYTQLWDMVIKEIKRQKPELLPYVEDLFPLGFASFCNTPYIPQKPENTNEAAWCLFMAVSEGQSVREDGYFLIGLLLAVYRLRNKYIHPLQGLPMHLEQLEEIEYIRYCTYKSIEILLDLPLNGIVRSIFN